MLKAINPKTEYTYKVDADTIITYKAQSGSAMFAYSGDLLFNHMIDTCVLKVTNIAIEMEFDIEDSEEKETKLVEFKEFIPSEHKEVKLHLVLPTTVCNGLATDMWSVSRLTKVEAGE